MLPALVKTGPVAVVVAAAAVVVVVAANTVAVVAAVAAVAIAIDLPLFYLVLSQRGPLSGPRFLYPPFWFEKHRP